MTVAFVLYAVSEILAATCPFTSKIGSLLGVLVMFARYAFVILCFIFAPHWWYGFIPIGITILSWIVINDYPQASKYGESLQESYKDLVTSLQRPCNIVTKAL